MGFPIGVWSLLAVVQPIVCALRFLSLSTLMLIIQPYIKSYMNVLDGLLLSLFGFITLLLVTFLYPAFI